MTKCINEIAARYLPLSFFPSYEAPNIPGSDHSYFTRDVEKHRERYKERAMPSLRIFETDIFEQDKTMRKQADEILKLKEKVDEQYKLFSKTIDDFQEEIEQQREEIERLRKRVEEKEG